MNQGSWMNRRRKVHTAVRSSVGGVLAALVTGLSVTACVPATILAYPKRTYEPGTFGAHVNEHFRTHVIG
ncbi:hypothetical protein F0U60_02630 [Archangium minus]|uniref:Lipoprotein n=1 Tax=Archangium minus TaxID=83450 RepID=A0ABY9WIW2_9BACT|nr:hypothetical protein F0U60_02630 [Archangium minus]